MPKISDLPLQSPLASTNEIVLNVGGVSKQAPLSEVNPFVDHTLIKNIGSNTHLQLDAHLANTSNPHVVTKAQVGLPVVENILNNFAAVTSPTINDDETGGYAVGSGWFNTAIGKAFSCLDASTGAAIWKETTAVNDSRVIVVNPASNSSSARSPYTSRSAGSTASTFFSFAVPEAFLSVINFSAMGVAGATGAGLDINLTVGYSSAGDAYNANSNTDTSSTYNTTVDEFLIIDLSALTTGFAPGDEVGVLIDHVGIGLTVYYTSLIFEYNRS